MPAITVIMPVYNAQRYLNRAVQSVAGQRFADWELLLVDDGSTDGSGRLCDEWSEKDPRIRAIHQKNGGTSAARNTGLRQASGDYVTFMDNDDYALDAWLETMHRLALQHNADIVRCGYYCVEPAEPAACPPKTRQECAPVQDEVVLEPGVITGTQAIERLALYPGYTSVWSQLIRRELLSGVLFPEGRLFEDTWLQLQLCRRPCRVYCAAELLYCWVMRPDSQGRAGNYRQALDGAEVLFDCIDFAAENGLDAAAERFRRIIWDFMRIAWPAVPRADENATLRAKAILRKMGTEKKSYAAAAGGPANRFLLGWCLAMPNAYHAVFSTYRKALGLLRKKDEPAKI